MGNLVLNVDIDAPQLVGGEEANQPPQAAHEKRKDTDNFLSR
jgi:hypothetical protein